MSVFAYITPPDSYCPACAKWLDTPSALDAHNIAASHGERSYRCAVNVPARTVETAKMRQGAGVRASGGA